MLIIKITLFENVKVHRGFYKQLMHNGTFSRMTYFIKNLEANFEQLAATSPAAIHTRPYGAGGGMLAGGNIGAQAGNYKLQGKVVLTSGTFYTDIHTFKVHCNL